MRSGKDLNRESAVRRSKAQSSAADRNRMHINRNIQIGCVAGAANDEAYVVSHRHDDVVVTPLGVTGKLS